MAKYIEKISSQYTGHHHIKEGMSVDSPVTPSTDISSPSQDRPKEQFANKTTGKFMGKVDHAIDKVMHTPLGERLTMGSLNKGWRGLILFNRLLGRPFDPVSNAVDTVKSLPGKAVAIIKKPKPGPTGKSKVRVDTLRGGNTTSTELNSSIQASRTIDPLHSRIPDIRYTWFPEDDTEDLESAVVDKYSGRNSVLIINPCLLDSNGNPSYVELQVRPTEIDYQPQSSWADIHSIGRNTPMYHYTGSETTLQFNTSWYMPHEPGYPEFNLYWVINQCRKLESWSMANGYMNAPPYLLIRWGDSDLFSEHLWILHSATYKLSDFRDILRIRNREFISEVGGESYTKENTHDTDYYNKYYPNERVPDVRVNQGLVPFSATQELIFKRVSGINLWYSEIAPQLQSLKTDYGWQRGYMGPHIEEYREPLNSLVPPSTLSTPQYLNPNNFPSDPTLILS